MPKKNKEKHRRTTPGLGKILIKDHKAGGLNRTDGWLHSSELPDGYDWGRLNLASVTEENHLDEFLRTAELAGIEFTAEKLHISVVTDTGFYTGLPQAQERLDIEKAQLEHRQMLSIPRRPLWDSSTTSEQLEIKERESFLEWRRLLAALQENEKLTMTPFERNLVFWRQLWRVIERSDIIVQIVDARNPLLFRCEDLEKYVKEIDQSKKNVILMSKCDLLTSEQRATWLKYFQSQNILVAFWSSMVAEEMNATEETEDCDSQHSERSNNNSNNVIDEKKYQSSKDTVINRQNSNDSEESSSNVIHVDEQKYQSSKDTVTNWQNSNDSEESSSDIEDVESCEDEMSDLNTNQVSTDVKKIITIQSDEADHINNSSGNEKANELCSDFLSLIVSSGNETEMDKEVIIDECPLLSCEELLQFFCDLCPNSNPSKDHPLTIGMVGYPNVGKSSTINALLKIKKVPVSATPGRTKHFQTLFVTDSIVLCDCPGLVFPNFVSTKADMVCNGILPIDQMRDHVPPVSLVCTRIPRHILEQSYGIIIPSPREGEDPLRLPYAFEVLASYGYTRGFMTAHGMPDQARSARYILKDYVNGVKLLYCEPPPGIDPNDFNTQLKLPSDSSTDAPNIKPELQKPPASMFDKDFFKKPPSAVYRKVISGTSNTGGVQQPNNTCEKPWKKHNNKHRNAKIRRVVGAGITNDHDYYY